MKSLLTYFSVLAAGGNASLIGNAVNHVAVWVVIWAASLGWTVCKQLHNSEEMISLCKVILMPESFLPSEPPYAGTTKWRHDVPVLCLNISDFEEKAHWLLVD